MSDEHDGPSDDALEQFSLAVYEATLKIVQQLAIKNNFCVRCYSSAIRSGLLHALAKWSLPLGKAIRQLKPANTRKKPRSISIG
jgi:hypothetical protein